MLTTQYQRLSSIAAILGYNIVTPSHVSKVAGLVLAHRLQLAHLSIYASEEVKEEFDNVHALDVVENVMAQVPSPQ